MILVLFMTASSGSINFDAGNQAQTALCFLFRCSSDPSSIHRPLEYQHFELRDQHCRDGRFDPDDETGVARRKIGGKADACLKNERDAALNQIFDDRRYIAIDEIHVQDRGGDGMFFEKNKRFLGACRRANDFATRVFDREREIQCNERFVFRDKDGQVIEQHMIPSEAI